MKDLKLKRWAVTYTKHLKQKRKVHHDGFLELHPSSNKVMLYDDSHNLLECRVMKKDEIVACGETLAFNAHIVDVGDSDTDEHKNDNGADINLQQVRVHAGEVETTSIGGAKKTRITLGPSRNLIREFKKTKLHKYESPRTSLATTEPSLTEWRVLYTAQVTQKAKKYHDGFLQVSLLGSLRGQVMLFDETKKLLDRRFLKKDEVIRCGDSIPFDAYLVDIGECEREQKPSLNGNSSNCPHVGKSNMAHARENYAKSDSITNEWQVLYTSQLTQKAKKYQDGFLHLNIFESGGRQILLYDSCRNSLEQRFLKKSETIRTGETVSLYAHMVEIGEPAGKNQPIESWNKIKNSDNIVGSREGHDRCGNTSSNRSFHKGKERDSKSISISTFRTTTSSKDQTSKPLRDACEILSILQKPATESFIPGLHSGGFETMYEQNVTASVHTKSFLDTISSKETIKYSGTQLPESKELGRRHQSSALVNIRHKDTAFADLKGSNSYSYSDEEAVTDIPGTAFGCDLSASLVCSSPDLVKDGERAEELTCAEGKHEFPSFHLGF